MAESQPNTQPPAPDTQSPPSVEPAPPPTGVGAHLANVFQKSADPPATAGEGAVRPEAHLANRLAMGDSPAGQTQTGESGQPANE